MTKLCGFNIKPHIRYINPSTVRSLRVDDERAETHTFVEFINGTEILIPLKMDAVVRLIDRALNSD